MYDEVPKFRYWTHEGRLTVLFGRLGELIIETESAYPYKLEGQPVYLNIWIQPLRKDDGSIVWKYSKRRARIWATRREPWRNGLNNQQAYRLARILGQLIAEINRGKFDTWIGLAKQHNKETRGLHK